ncbi:MAG: carbon-nitrogen hydrolase family protein [Nocardioidaceae bacterium]|nr:carbon-nitrogen hydrolase family protein [Nocardioidaceae bacterium]
MFQPPFPAPRQITVAAVQPALTLGTVGENLTRLDRLIRDAVSRHRPDVVMVPESATTPNVYARVLRTTVQPVDGAPMQLLRDLARELGVVVGGGFVARRGDHARGTFVLAEHDGAAHLHDKDIPTMWENNYYAGGNGPGLTTLGTLGEVPVGIASGWEWARMGTARRLRGRVGILLGGMCWPSYPLNWRGPFGALACREHALQRQAARELPRQVARLIGAPVVHASHVGPISFATPLAPGVSWRTEMLGETQIVERDGTIVARLTTEDGEGHVAATVNLAAPEPSDPLAPTYWIPPFSVTTRAAWRAMNTHGAVKYRALRATGRHPWQGLPDRDLPDEIAPGASLDQTLLP